MHLSLNWLADHVDLSGIDAGRVAHELTMRTALVEGYSEQAREVRGVVVGEVLECARHPDADTLSLCRVDAGDGEGRQVVCGAPNVAAGQKVLYAPVGTSLPIGLKLKKARIRGQESHGMICAEDELGLGTEHDGILVLDPATEAGTPIDALADLTDVVLEIDNKSVTHRPDLWGHRGFARELAAIFERELRDVPLDERLAPGDDGVAIVLEAGDGCPLYAGLAVEARPGRAPDRIRRRLFACGMRPISLLVDLSNYVMLELGQPTHPFDRDRLAGDTIVVRAACEGETLVTLDEVERALRPEDVVIADAERLVAIAGIMGGRDTEVSDATTRMVLESASFDPRAVRRTSSRLGLRTEALARFEKALDPALVEQAVRRYARLLREHDPEAVVAPTFRVAGAARAPSRTLVLSTAMVARRLGMPLTRQEVARRLGSLGFTTQARDEDVLEVGVPAWRATRDVTIAEDLVEEVGRLAGYERVSDRAPVGPLCVGTRETVLELEDRARDALVGYGFTEAMHYSVVDDRALAVAAPGEDPGALPRLANALKADATRLRPAVAPGLLARLEPWLRHAEHVRVFEVGRGYRPRDGEVDESREVCALFAWRGGGGDDLVRRLRGVAQSVLADLGHRAPAIRPVEARAPWLHPRKTAALLVGEREVAHLAPVHPQVLARADVPGAVAGLVVLDAAAIAACGDPPPAYAPVGRYPPVRIDLAFVIDDGTSVAALVDALRAAGPRTLRDVRPFDVYRGGSLADDERSVALHLVFQSRDRTLEEKQVLAARERLVEAAARIGARLR